jgi:transcriptional regulator with XRE-family HTH domain
MAGRAGWRENGGAKDGDADARFQAFADELRAQREAAGLTQEQLAKLMGYSPSVVAKLETCRTMPSAQHAEQADAALKTPGTFVRLRSVIMAAAFEPWFVVYLDIEARATVLRSWQPLVVDGLLQTESYARAMLRAGRPGDSDAAIEQLVDTRMARQRIWGRQDPPPPMLSVILGEGVLRQCVGDGVVMREQLGHLAEAGASPRVTIQVMPFAMAAHPGMLGPFVVASFDTGPDAAYLDNALAGQVTERRKEVSRLSLLYDTLRSEALSPGASLEMIARVKDEWT